MSMETTNYSKPEIQSEPKEKISGKGFMLTCLAHGGYPQGDIRWKVDDLAWNNNPEVKVEKTPNGLYNLASTLTFGPESLFKSFVCEVYNAEGVKESEEKILNNPSPDKVKNEADKEEKAKVTTQIVAPVVVIGSLIVGLLAALLLCRRKRQPPPSNPDECQEMCKEVP
ncbi:hypothetical protein WMY93_006331 [Mugilogobius chulae]|uniref:Ig-like domain-containing protein n=1 Tax=Mugilogobius chulae TaxID=88201 RepID=A0AAW0PW06_9GOBI